MFNYGVKALYVGGASPYSTSFEGISTNLVQNVLSTNMSLVYPRTDLFGWDGGGNQELVDRPRVQFSYSYFPVSGYNESNIGFVLGSVAPALSNMNVERNYYIRANNQNADAFSYSGLNSFVFALGNCVMTNYDFSAGVGQFATATVTTEALNLIIQTGGSGQLLPAITKQYGQPTTGIYSLNQPVLAASKYNELQPGNISLMFDTGSAVGALMSGNNSCPVQSFRFSINMPRIAFKNLGWAYPDTRSVTWPITINVQADAFLNGVQKDTLNRYVCADSGYDFTIKFRNSCLNADDYSFVFQGAKLENQSISAQVGQSDRVSLYWSLKINDISRMGSGNPNFFITSQNQIPYQSVVFPQISVTGGTGMYTVNFGTYCYLQVLNGIAVLKNNSGYLSEDTNSAVIRATVSGTSTYQDVRVTGIG